MIFRKARRLWIALAAIAVVVGGLTASASVARAASNPSAPPVMTLGTYQTSEDSSPNFIPISGSGQPNAAPTYLSWGQGLPTTFMSSAYSQGATPYLEFEPWHQGPSWNATPSFSAIASNGDASDTNCSLDMSTYTTSCATWLADIGKAIASYGHPVVLTFAHEFNVSGQYPWAQGDTGSCGSSACTPSQWIAAWDEVQSIIDANAGGNAFWIWAPNADTGGTTTDPSPYWPGASKVDLVGVDGYPDTTYGSQFGTFSGEFGPVFTEIRNLGYTGGIFISETNLSPLDSSGYETIPSFISDLCTNGGTGFLEWEDGGAPAMTATQWSQANTALASDCTSGSPPPAQGAPAVATGSASGVTSTSATLNGTVNPEGADASWQFDGGTTTAYGDVAPSPAGDAGSGTSAVSESTTITGLTPSTTYHFRIEATNSGGTSYGSDVTFTTSSSGSGGGTWSCTTTANSGVCPSGGNYNGTLTGAAQQDTEVVQNVSNPSSAFAGQTLQANSASNWQVTADIAAGNTAFISFPDVQDTLTNTSGHPVPLADYTSLATSYATTLPSAGSSDDWAAGYSFWLGQNSTGFTQQVQVWTANHGQVPSGSDIGQVWTDPGSGASYEMWVNWNTGVITLVPKVNSTSGTFNIYYLLEYLTQNGFSYATGISQVQYGFILSSTSGASKTFAVTNFTLAGTGDGKNGAPSA